MKHLILLLGSVLILHANVSIAQSSSADDTDRKQILEFIEQWGQEVLIGRNLDNINNYFAKNGVELIYYNQKIEETIVEQTIKEFLSGFEQGKFTGYTILGDPYIFITEDGHTAITSYTVELEYEDFKTKKKDKYSEAVMEVLIKEDGKWVEILLMQESIIDRKVVPVNKNILDEYSGMYKNEKSETGKVNTITNDGKKLIFTTSTGKQFSLIPQSEYSFFIKDQPQSIIFGRDKNGKVSFYTYINENRCFVVNKIK